MKTWNNYKKHVKSVNTTLGNDISNIETITKIVETIIERRNSLGISQRELASLCKVPQSTIARIESYTTTPTLDTLLKILRPLGLALTISSID